MLSLISYSLLKQESSCINLIKASLGLVEAKRRNYNEAHLENSV